MTDCGPSVTFIIHDVRLIDILVQIHMAVSRMSFAATTRSVYSRHGAVILMMTVVITLMNKTVPQTHQVRA